MAFRITILYSLLSFIFIRLANAQEVKWQKDVPGKIYPLRSATAVGVKLAPIFSILERIPIIAHPKGFDVHESFVESTVEVPLMAAAHVNFFNFYTYDNGPVQQSKAHVPTLSVVINNPKVLMDDQNYLFSEETGALGLPQLFTDTFPVTYRMINGYSVGVAVGMQFGRNNRMYVLNPRHVSLFRPVTKEEYLKAFIKNLSTTIDGHKDGLVESKKNIADLEKMKQFKDQLGDLKELNAAMIKWVQFLEGKRDYFQNKLASLLPSEKKAPAVYAMYKDIAVMKDRDHNYLKEISGHIPYEPLEITSDTVSTAALYTFNEKTFDPQLPKNAFQLMVITEAFDMDSNKEMKFVLDKDLYPLIPFKELAALMYK